MKFYFFQETKSLKNEKHQTCLSFNILTIVEDNLIHVYNNNNNNNNTFLVFCLTLTAIMQARAVINCLLKAD